MTRAERIDENVAILGSSPILIAVLVIFLLDDRSGPLLQSLWMGIGGLAISCWLWALVDLVWGRHRKVAIPQQKARAIPHDA